MSGHSHRGTCRVAFLKGPALFPSMCSVAQSCLTLCDPMDCSPPGSSVHGIFQARILEWVAISSSRGSFWPRDWTCVSCIAGRFFNAEPLGGGVVSCISQCPGLTTRNVCWLPGLREQICRSWREFWPLRAPGCFVTFIHTGFFISSLAPLTNRIDFVIPWVKIPKGWFSRNQASSRFFPQKYTLDTEKSLSHPSHTMG